MEQLILDYLGKQFEHNFCSTIQFAPVPKGQNGDLAMSFFKVPSEGLQSVLKSITDADSDPEIKKIIKGSAHSINVNEKAKVVAFYLRNCPLLEKTEIAGPYLNLFFKNEAFFEQVFKTPLESKLMKGKTIVLEFSGPNTNKPLHLGHMRNHALGISVSNLLEQVGAKVHRVNIINDRGVHICKSMLAYQKWGEGKTPESTGIKPDLFVGNFYVRFEQESKNDENLMTEVQEMLQKWESGDKDVMNLWKKMSQWALAGHAKTYTRQGIKFEKDYFESDYYLKGKDIAEQGLKKNVFKKRADGAIVIDLTDEGLDEKVILRADGTSIYLTQDLAVAQARKKDFSPDQLMYVVADEQNYHFKVLFSCLDKLGLLKKEECHHLGYGLVNLPDGRMKSREGTVVDADNLMDELSGLALEAIEKRNPELSKEEAKQMAEQIQNAAWKFYLLSTSPKKSITFDSQKSIQFEGATGPYLQYAGVRIKSILKKASLPLTCLPDRQAPSQKEGELSLSPRERVGVRALGNAEKPLGVKLIEFPKVLERASETLNPTYIVTYLLELAQEWSSFYAENSVINAETEALKNARIQLAQKVLDVLETGLMVLGIEIPEKM